MTTARAEALVWRRPHSLGEKKIGNIISIYSFRTETPPLLALQPLSITADLWIIAEVMASANCAQSSDRFNTDNRSGISRVNTICSRGIRSPYWQDDSVVRQRASTRVAVRGITPIHNAVTNQYRELTFRD